MRAPRPSASPSPPTSVALRSAARLRRAALACALLLLCALGSGCSVKRMAAHGLADALAAGGGALSSDDDPELVRDAAPFALKLMESVLAEVPRHDGLLLAASSSFTQYAYAFLDQEADYVEERDYEAALALRERARRMYLRARELGLRGLEERVPGSAARLRLDARAALAGARAEDVPWLYWTAAAWGGAIALSKDRPELIGELPIVEALLERALALDPDWSQGALHALMIGFESARAIPDSETRARAAYERALAASHGQAAGPHLALVEAVELSRQDRAACETLLERALAIDPDAQPQARLANLLAQRRARWLRARLDELILPPLEAEPVPSP
jgi:predicted anti-sigma-YlaC factor YlaD